MPEIEKRREVAGHNDITCHVSKQEQGRLRY